MSQPINLDELSLDQLKIILVDEVLAAERVGQNIEVIKTEIHRRMSMSVDKSSTPQSPDEFKDCVASKIQNP
jgi:hypothetical protein